ncbi:unnamed protein product [Symbiodinium sp. KB8]|nr:unnamed protein product [Symbiodinium sp. KB8]
MRRISAIMKAASSICFGRSMGTHTMSLPPSRYVTVQHLCGVQLNVCHSERHSCLWT